jgi:hypothetical protein
VPVKGKQVEVHQLLSGQVKLVGLKAEDVLDAPVPPEAQAAAICGEGEVEIEELGGIGHRAQQVTGEEAAREPGEGALDGAQAVGAK